MGQQRSVSAMAVLDLYDQLLQLGVATVPQMQAAGLYRERLIDAGPGALPIQEQRVDELRLLELWQLAASATSIPHIGLLLGEQINPDTRGVLASWLFQCERADEAFAVFVKHIALMNPSESWQAREENGCLELHLSFAPERAYPQAAIERSMSALLHWHRALTGEQVVPLACDFAFAQPAYIERLHAVFGSRLRFACTANCIRVPITFLQHPIRGANPYLKRLLEERALHTYAQLQQGSALVVRVRQLITATLRGGVHIQQICDAVHLSRPTLYRRLKQDGASFSELLESVRKDLAKQQLQQGVPLAALSDALGFRDQSTLHRAFKRWFPSDGRSGLSEALNKSP